MWCEMKLTRLDGKQDTLTFSVESETEAAQVCQSFAPANSDKSTVELPELAHAA